MTEMRDISVRLCWKDLRDSDCDADISWLSQLPMACLSGAARAYMYGTYLTASGKPLRARSFLELAEGLATDEERPYVRYLRSTVELLVGNAEEAMGIAATAREMAHEIGDMELEKMWSYSCLA